MAAEAFVANRNDGDAPVIEVDHLGKRYHDVTAVGGISFTVDEGELFGFLGPNGAGKTTTIGMLCTLIQPTSGRARVADHDVVADRDAVRRSIGLVSQDSTLDPLLTAAQNLRFHGTLCGIGRVQLRARITELLELLGLSDRRDAPVLTLSGGMKRRLEIARGLLHTPRVLFLDEPTLGLDPGARRAVWDHIHELRAREGTTIFLTTHYLDEAEYCDRIAILTRGRIVVRDSPSALKAEVGADRVEVGTDDQRATRAALLDRFGIEAVETGSSLSFHVADGASAVPRLLAQPGLGITSVSVSRPTLDDVFLRHTGTTIDDPPSGDGPMMMQVFAKGAAR